MSEDAEVPVAPAASAAGKAAAAPSAPESSFDLIALERTRFALRAIGVAYLIQALAMAVWFEIPASLLACASSLVLLVATAASAPTPHGPFPRVVRSVYMCVWILDCAWNIGLAAFVRIKGTGAYAPPFPWWLYCIVLLIGVAYFSLPVVFWRFCQMRGLSGIALLWLWLAMGHGVTWIVFHVWTLMTAMADPTAEALAWPFGTYWVMRALLLLGAFVLAQRTAKAVWLDALNRHARVFAIANPPQAVEPLRPADRH